ncbi:Deoxyribodipyrimidine photo-lyase-related protein [Poriferisphaera corsica]|uniref:Deoxyribodipyrimidine photo-lyase-related protein n=1 Tax=Poriferisphaera corsica TaxID=2528020 RepID=A0A517YTJ5_9BACT|nr:cryptochrome/photolyase family protein [Poriferisphaera corsica]QDU33492.1 Deoxyribodipyrimidine photo-lyase-related protein [Poriferisphaera corsica]
MHFEWDWDRLNNLQNKQTFVVVFGDQLDIHSVALRDDGKPAGLVWMAEAIEEAEYVWSHQLRLAFFFSTMRHFREELKQAGYEVMYREISARKKKGEGYGLMEMLEIDLRAKKIKRVRCVRPGDWRVLDGLRKLCKRMKIELEVLEDKHFLMSVDAFGDWAKGKKQLVMEGFYRGVRKKYGYLIREDGKPEGGEWNYDSENRDSFGKDGPGDKMSDPKKFKLDRISEDVVTMVRQRFSCHPGSLEHFNLPVTRKDAETYLKDFIANRLKLFGKYEDAMWEGEAFLYHSRISCLLNVKLLDPKRVIDLAIEAYRNGKVGIESTEGFVRQVAGWREFIRGIYWLKMPEYAKSNALKCSEKTDVPGCFWDGETDMKCVADSMKHVIDHGYAHHIHRLMVLGLLAQLVGVHPYKFHEWHMGMYLDAIDWVSLPNTLGMSQWGDGGVVGTKPYCASGNYINKMSNYCKGCRYDPKLASGEKACPMTVLYWDFLGRHEKQFEKNIRMKFQIANLKRKSVSDMKMIKEEAARVKIELLRKPDLG